MANLCLKAGCPGLCCINRYFEDLNPADAYLLIDAHPHSEQFINQDSFETICEFLGMGDPSVSMLKWFHHDGSDGNYGISIALFGRCPHLNEQNECQIYADRPLACQNLIFEGEICLKIRSHAE